VAGPCEYGDTLSSVLMFWTVLTNSVIRSCKRKILIHAVIFQVSFLYLNTAV